MTARHCRSTAVRVGVRTPLRGGTSDGSTYRATGVAMPVADKPMIYGRSDMEYQQELVASASSSESATQNHRQPSVTLVTFNTNEHAFLRRRVFTNMQAHTNAHVNYFNGLADISSKTRHVHTIPQEVQHSVLRK